MSMDRWAAEEFSTAELGDGRLTKRLIKVASALAEKPTASLPGACSGWAETLAAYRFFDQASEKKQGLGWEDLLTPHMECTYVMAPDREPLGLLDAWIWARELKDAQGHRPGIPESTR